MGGCIDRFEEYVGAPHARSELFAIWLLPTDRSWGAGDREVVCVLLAPEEELGGSMRGSQR